MTGDGVPSGESSALADETYVFDSGDVVAAVAIVDSAYVDLDFGYRTVNRVKEAAATHGVTGTALELELIHATAHHLRREVDDRPGCDLGRDETDGLRWPRPIAQTPPNAVLLWEKIAGAATSPTAVARFEDLLFVKRHGNRFEHACRAARAYLSGVAGAPEIDMAVIDAVLRIWSLARSVSESTIDTQVRELMASVADQVMATTPGQHPGVVLPLLSALASGPIGGIDDPHDVDAMLRRAAETFTTDIHAGQIASDRRRRAKNNPDTLNQIARDEVAAHIKSANKTSEPAVKMLRLNAAAKLATQRGLPDVAREAARLMQQIKPSDLKMQRLRVEVPINAYTMEALAAPFTQGSSWRDGLAHFLNTGAPTGSIEHIQRTGKLVRGPLASIFPSTLLGSSGLPRASTQTEADETANDNSQVASFTAKYFGQGYALGLLRMPDVYSMPTVEELTLTLANEGCRDPRLAQGLAKGFKHYWDGDFESSVAVTIPKFEAAARAILQELDEGIYKVQISPNNYGGFVTLRPLLDELDKLALDPSWAHFYRWLFLGPYGANLRNDVAHGFIFDPGPTLAALILRAVSSLALVAGPLPDNQFEPGEASIPTRTRAEALYGLAHPVGERSTASNRLGAVAESLERLAMRIRARQAREAVDPEI